MTQDNAIVVVPVPPSLSAEIVYVVTGDGVVGVPVIIPVLVSNIKPSGRSGPIEYVSGGPPVLAGVQVLMVVPTVKIFVDGV